MATFAFLVAALAPPGAQAAAPAAGAIRSAQAGGAQVGSAQAVPKRFALFVGPSLLSSDLATDLGRDHVLANGFVLEAAVRIRGPLSLIVEAARHAETLHGFPVRGRRASQATVVVGIGYRPDPRGAWRPIAHAAVGRATASVDVEIDLPIVGRLPIVSHGFAATLGAGAERSLGESWSWRVAQVDVVVTDYFATNADVRLTSGLSIRF